MESLGSFKPPLEITTQKSSVELEIFQIFQHKVERTLHFMQIIGNVHIYINKIFR